MAQVNITIIGLGKIGASFGLALRALNAGSESPHKFTVVGYDTDSAISEKALKLEVIDRADRNVASAVQNADVVITALSLLDTEKYFGIIGDALKPGAVVMDTSILKRPPIRWAESQFSRKVNGKSGAEPSAYLVGVTPVINPAYVDDPRNTIDAAHVDLFKNGLLILAPDPSCPMEAVQLISDIADLMRVKIHYADPSEHDGIQAAMEGLPLLLQFAVFQSLSASSSWDDLRWFGNANFYFNSYRLGQESAEDLGAIIAENREASVRRLDAAIESLTELRDVLLNGDNLAVAEGFEKAQRNYDKWWAARQRNKWNDEEMPEIRPAFRMMGGLLSPFKRKANDK